VELASFAAKDPAFANLSRIPRHRLVKIRCCGHALGQLVRLVRAPPTCLQRRVTSHRTSLTPLDLADIKMSDLSRFSCIDVLDGLSGVLRQFLLENKKKKTNRGELPDSSLVAMVPWCQCTGNRIGLGASPCRGNVA